MDTPASAPVTSSGPRRRLDLASLALLALGLVSGAFACWVVGTQDTSVAIVIPSVIATVTGARHITKWEAPRQTGVDAGHAAGEGS